MKKHREEEKLRNQKEDFSDMVAEVRTFCFILLAWFLLNKRTQPTVAHFIVWCAERKQVEEEAAGEGWEVEKEGIQVLGRAEQPSQEKRAFVCLPRQKKERGKIIPPHIV